MAKGDRDDFAIRMLNAGVLYFNEHWNEIADVIDYNDEWESIKHFTTIKVKPENKITIEKCVQHDDVKQISPGKLVKSISDSGRRIIFIGTRLGPIVLYTESNIRNVSGVRCVSDSRFDKYRLIPPMTKLKFLHKVNIQHLLGETRQEMLESKYPNVHTNNIGFVLETLFDYFNKGNSKG